MPKQFSFVNNPVKRIKSVFFLSLILCSLAPGEAIADTDKSKSDKPLIGINLDVEAGKPKQYRIVPPYVDAIKRAGGIPILIPPLAQEDLPALIDQLDGVLMIGGNDYPPEMYKQTAHETSVPMESERAEFDIALVKAVLKNGQIPFLGICAGCQALNIGAGGTLVQDIPSHYKESQVRHASPEGWQKGFNKHIVKPEEGCNLSKIIGKELLVVTSHHQCIDKVGDGFNIAARTADGVIESIESKDGRFIVGVQWHPERDFDVNQALFGELIKKSKAARQARLASPEPAKRLSDKGCDFEPTEREDNQ